MWLKQVDDRFHNRGLKSTDPAPGGRGMKADLLPNLKARIAVCLLRRRAAGNLPVLN